MPIEIRGGDDEWKEILANGPLCIVYDAELYLDLDAVDALRNEDNLNASIEMKADELQVLGRISGNGYQQCLGECCREAGGCSGDACFCGSGSEDRVSGHGGGYVHCGYRRGHDRSCQAARRDHLHRR